MASCRFDLDSALRFTDGLILLTDRRVIADQPASADGEPTAAAAVWSWRLDPSTAIDVHLRSAIGRIELSQHGGVVARWLFTAARAKGVHALEDAFDARVHGQATPRRSFTAEEQPEQAIAPAAGGPWPPGPRPRRQGSAAGWPASHSPARRGRHA